MTCSHDNRARCSSTEYLQSTAAAAAYVRAWQLSKHVNTHTFSTESEVSHSVVDSYAVALQPFARMLVLLYWATADFTCKTEAAGQGS